MSFSSIMVSMNVGAPNSGPLRVAACLAERFGASLLGIAGVQRMDDVDCYATSDMFEGDRARINEGIAQAEAQFRSAVTGRCPNVSWRSVDGKTSLGDDVVKMACSVDLIITGPDSHFSTINASRGVVVSDLILGAGRPVLLVPLEAEEPDLRRVVVAWKDTREARRATLDALPLLAMAERVTIVEVAKGEDLPAARSGLADVKEWLGRHGVTSKATVLASIGDDGAQLRTFARENEASVIVAGAYGHGRLREWYLGGVTRDLVVHPERCSLVSH
jgi:nucleotide-binding universal stress UspA family protein